MIELIILYCVFMYLFAIGFAYETCKQDNDLGTYDKIGLSVCFIIAPLIIPVVLGIVYAHDKS